MAGVYSIHRTPGNHVLVCSISLPRFSASSAALRVSFESLHKFLISARGAVVEVLLEALSNFTRLPFAKPFLDRLVRGTDAVVEGDAPER